MTDEKNSGSKNSDNKTSDKKPKNDDVYPGMTVGYAEGVGAEAYKEGQYDSDEVNRFYSDRKKNGA